MIGLCKQTGEFKSECLHLVEQYSSTIYNFLVSELKGAELCSLIGICTNKTEVTIAPLIPKDLAVKAVKMSTELIGQDEANSYITEVNYIIQMSRDKGNSVSVKIYIKAFVVF